MLRMMAALWGFSGIVGLLGAAVIRLSSRALEILHHPLSAVEWVALVVTILFMAYFEGYRGFQQGFSPRVASRIFYLGRSASWIEGALAPLFCMGFFGTTPLRQRISILVTLMIILMVYGAGHLPMPWRGIVDAGVVIGLLWGLSSVVFFSGKAFLSKDFIHEPELAPGKVVTRS